VNLYLVYDLEIDPTPSPSSLWKEAAADFTPAPVGAYFAENPNSACKMAAKHHGRAGIYAAIQAASYAKLDLTPEALSDDDRQELEKRARKEKEKALGGGG
jgi:hypothetical protein